MPAKSRAHAVCIDSSVHLNRVIINVHSLTFNIYICIYIYAVLLTLHTNLNHDTCMRILSQAACEPSDSRFIQIWLTLRCLTHASLKFDSLFMRPLTHAPFKFDSLSMRPLTHAPFKFDSLFMFSLIHAVGMLANASCIGVSVYVIVH